ncbi:MAG: YggS family pyridoxal phosphate-dependent enzyme [Opitutus sp.]
MFLSYEEFTTRADRIRNEIAAACVAAGRNPVEVELLAVTKTHPADAVDYAARYGLKAVGENRVQEGVEKRALTTAQIRWELIGHLQSNKSRVAAATFDRIQSVDSEKLLNQLDRGAMELGKTLAILLQINAGRDPAKFGADLEDAPRLLSAALTKKNLRVDGFMTIAPLSSDPAVAQQTFGNLRELRDQLAAENGVALQVLSMGMSGDFSAAIAAGSTMIRVGSALFGAREPSAQ